MLKVSSEKEVTIDQVVADATALYNVRKNVKKVTKEFESTMWDRHKDLARAYPVVYKYIIYEGIYNANVFKKYLKYIQKNPWKNEQGYIESQAVYLVMLYKSLNPNSSRSTLDKVRKNAITILTQEHESLKNMTEAAKRQVEDWEARRNKELQEETLSFFEKWGTETLNLDIRSENKIEPAQVPILEPIKPEFSFDSLI